MKSTRSFAVCPNCGAPTPDAYCPSCGQRNLDLHSSVRALLGDALEESLGADSTMLRTLRALIVEPGELSRAYRLGRRAAYSSPWKVYLAAGAVRVVLGKREIASRLAFLNIAPAGPLLKPNELAELHRTFASSGWWSERIRQHLDVLASPDPSVASAADHAFSDGMRSGFSVAFIALMPIFALVLFGLHRRDRFYIDHLIFMLHWQAAFFLISTVMSWLPLGTFWYWDTGLLVAAYTLLALHRMYGDGWGKTALKTIAFLAAAFAAFTVGMGVLVAVELLLV